MSQSASITVQGHAFDISADKSAAGRWTVEVTNAARTAFAFDPDFDSADAAIAHATAALQETDIANFLG